MIGLKATSLCITMELGQEGAGVGLMPSVEHSGPGNIILVSHEKVVSWLKLALEVARGDSKL